MKHLSIAAAAVAATYIYYSPTPKPYQTPKPRADYERTLASNYALITNSGPHSSTLILPSGRQLQVSPMNPGYYRDVKIANNNVVSATPVPVKPPCTDFFIRQANPQLNIAHCLN